MKTTIITLAVSFAFAMGVSAMSQTGTLSGRTSDLNSGVLAWAQDKPQSQEAVKTKIATSDLMKPIQDHLATQYKGWTVSEAYRVDAKGVITYKVLVKMGTEEKRLVYDNTGKFMKEATGEKMHSSTKEQTAPPK